MAHGPSRRGVLAALLSLLWLAACAPAPEPPVVTPKLEAAALVASDGRRLPLRRWGPEGAPKAVVLALHGFGGFGLVFQGLGERLAGEGYALLAIDQRGFGDDPDRGSWPGGGRLVADARDFIRAADDADPDLPRFLLGVSMGGAVAIDAAAGRSDLAGLVLAAPAARGPAGRQPFLDALLGLGARVLPWLGLAVEHDDPRLTERANRLFRNDPRVVRRMTVAAYDGILGLADDAFKAAPRITAPTLLLHGTADPILPEAAIDGLQAVMKAPTRRVVLEGGIHNLLNQKDVDAAGLILAFLADPKG
ncbi:MAG: alpha/beta fold hydrolase [Geminicoccaceae bacterium]|nr:alpha/beta fold hydrolase [Geminicoccaceae bacterium]